MDRVQRWLDVARWSPSGGNAQPWQVRVNRKNDEIELRIEISDEYRRDPSPMDVEGTASVIALGAFVRSLRYVCANDGFHVVAVDFEFGAVHWRSAVILHVVSLPTPRVEGAYSNQEIQARRTDRGAYQTTPLSPEFLSRFQSMLAKFSSVRAVEFAAHSEIRKEQLIVPLARIERVRWRNSRLLDALLHEVSFSEGDVDRKIPVSQLGISKIDRLVLQALRSWPFARRVFCTPVVEIPVRRAVRDFCWDCERVVFLEAVFDEKNKNDEFLALIELGECFQMIWLEASRQGVSFQPLGLPLIVLGYWRDRGIFSFSDNEISALELATNEFREKFDIDLKRPVLGFRLGKTMKLAERAPRSEIPLSEDG